MDKKIRGIIDPYTLGFLLGILGVFTAHAVHTEAPSPENTVSAIPAAEQQFTEIPKARSPEASRAISKFETDTLADE